MSLTHPPDCHPPHIVTFYPADREGDNKGTSPVHLYCNKRAIGLPIGRGTPAAWPAETDEWFSTVVVSNESAECNTLSVYQSFSREVSVCNIS